MSPNKEYLLKMHKIQKYFYLKIYIYDFYLLFSNNYMLQSVSVT